MYFAADTETSPTLRGVALEQSEHQVRVEAIRALKGEYRAHPCLFMDIELTL